MRMPVQNSPLGGIAQRMNDTMLKFFLSQPTGMERDYMQAGTDLRRASLETERMKAAAAQQAYDAPRTIAEAFRGMASPPEAARPSPDMVGPMAQMAPDQAVARFLPDALQGIAALDTGDIGSVFRALVANTPGTSNEAVTRAFAGAGGKLGVNDALLPGRQDQLRTENFGQETSLNNADNAAAMARQGSANAAAMARQMTTEAAARGGAFRNLPVEQQALAVGPSAEEAKGGWIADIMLGRRPMDDDAGAVISPSIAVAGVREAGANARQEAYPSETQFRGRALSDLFYDGLDDLSPGQWRALGADRSNATPRNYITADGQQGVTLDGVTDAATNTPIPAGAQVFTGQVQGTGADSMVPSSVIKDDIDADVTATNILAQLDDLHALASDSTQFGAAGALRGFAQEGTEQVRGLANIFGADGDAAANVIQQSLPGPMQGFDEALPQLDSRIKTLTYQFMKLFDDRLSNADQQIGAEIIGSRIKSLADFRAREQALRDMVSRMVGSRNAVRGRPPGAGPMAAQPASAAPRFAPLEDPLGVR